MKAQSFTVDNAIALARTEPLIAAVVAPTKQPDEPLTDSMVRAAADPTARVVKLADIADNNDPARLRLLDPETADRLRGEYAQSIELLEKYAAPRVREL